MLLQFCQEELILKIQLISKILSFCELYVTLNSSNREKILKILKEN